MPPPGGAVGAVVGGAATGGGFGFFGSGDGLTDEELAIDGRAFPAGPSPNRRSTFIVA
jgi:hypothetical protein